MGWGRFIESPAADEHGVQLYGRLDELAASVAAFFAAGLADGAGAIAIATPEHWQACAEALAACDVDVVARLDDGTLIVLDARETLAAVQQRGLEPVVAPLLDGVQARCPGRSVRLFGEMVDLLWQERRRAEALELELEWNALQQRRPFSLLCAYDADVFDVAVQQGLAPMFDAHTHAHPVADHVRLSAALDAALGEVLAPDEVARFYLDAAGAPRNDGVPRAQAVIAQLVEQDPVTAASVLGRARAHYA